MSIINISLVGGQTMQVDTCEQTEIVLNDNANVPTVQVNFINLVEELTDN